MHAISLIPDLKTLKAKPTCDFVKFAINDVLDKK